MSATGKSRGKRFFDKFTAISVKSGNEIHLRSLRDSFATIMPLFILAGLGVLMNNVVFPWFAHGQTLIKLQLWGTNITNGTLNIAGLALAPVIG
ncbi:PTS sugar transporter subunit IIC, partial [Lactobacillus sp. XV13L]|nr:PTS sugar transporter subunit IIC [Lactobacillus sp. XV13L]